jgi:hypothetical protein
MKTIKKAQFGKEIIEKQKEIIAKQEINNQKKKDSTYESNTKINVEKSLRDLSLNAQQAKENKKPKWSNKKKKTGGSIAKAKDGKWIQKATASIKRRGTEGKCTPITKPGCTGKAKALAMTFKKMAKNRKKK